MLIKEMNEQLELQDLLEDFGNLKFIRSDFMRAFTYTGDSKYDPTVRRGELIKHIGRDSEVETKVIRSTASAFEQMEEDKSILGFIIIRGEDVHAKKNQLAIVVRQFSGSTTSSGPVFNVIINKDYLAGNKDLTDDLESRLKNVFIASGKTNQQGYSLKDGQARHVGVAIMKSLKASNEDFRVAMVKVDKERAKKGVERAEQKKGRVLTPAEAKRFGFSEVDMNKQAKAALMNRLAKFKSERAPGPGKDEDFVEWIKNTGYIDRIKVMGAVYELHEQRLNFDDIKSGGRQWTSNYISYRLTQQEKSKWRIKMRESDELADRYIEARNITEPDEKREVYMNFYKRFGIPPGQFKVRLKLEKAAIVPDEIEFFEL